MRVCCCADVPRLDYLVQEWEEGIYLAVNNQLAGRPVRTSPVRQLEAEIVIDKTQQPWRSGKPMRVLIMDRKAIWYAYLRRRHGHPLTPAAAASAAAAAAAAGLSSSTVDAGAAAAAAAAGSGGSSSDAGGSSSGNTAAGSTGDVRMTSAQAVTDLEVLAR